MKTYQDLIAETGLLLNEKKAPFLITLGPFETLIQQVFCFMAKEERAPYSMGDAIVSDNMGFTLIANF
jgi:hypothetical protein